MPTWVDSHERPNEDLKRAKTVSVLVRAMQGALEERLEEHRRRAAPAAAWITEREERRGLIRHVFLCGVGWDTRIAQCTRCTLQPGCVAGVAATGEPPATQSATHM